MVLEDAFIPTSLPTYFKTYNKVYITCIDSTLTIYDSVTSFLTRSDGSKTYTEHTKWHDMNSYITIVAAAWYLRFIRRLMGGQEDGCLVLGCLIDWEVRGGSPARPGVGGEEIWQTKPRCQVWLVWPISRNKSEISRLHNNVLIKIKQWRWWVSV